MYISPKAITAPKAPKLEIWPKNKVLLNGGLNLVDKEWKINENQTSKVLNEWWYNGELGRRWGQDYLNSGETVETPCYASYKYFFMGYIIKHCGTKIYKQDPSTGVITSISTGLNTSKGVFFKFNGKLYYKQLGKYIAIDSTLTASAVIPYIPTVIINRTPTGGGNTNENYNRIGAGFKNSFNGNGSATAYTLTDTSLDATLVTATVGGVSKVETTDFTVNRSTGVVTFVSAPASGTNNVIITAYKTVQTDIDTILNSLYVMPFGGQNDNRVFVGGGNGGYYYWTGISTVGVDPTYFAYNNYNIIGLTDEPIYGFGKQYDTLCIFKAREIYGVTYSFNGTTGVFSTFPVNSQIGCDCPDSIQTINNNLVWLNTYNGVYTLVGTAVESQRNVFLISRNINPRLLAESNLTLSTSVDFNGKYWLCVNDKVYLWDYFTSPYVDTGNPDQSAKILSWWYFDSINAGSWTINGQDLYYIQRDTGKTVKFHVTYNSNQFYDFGNGISSVYRYPAREMGGGIYEFSVEKGFVGVRGDLKTAFTVTYFNSDDFNGDPSTETIEVGSFSWDNFSWDNFTWDVMGPIYEAVLLPGAKNVRWFAAEFSNSDGGRDMNISSIEWLYKQTKLVK